ncbi:response regulator [Enterococcus sp. AZ194]|uniref:response regulator n=1 Tax=Enterococcus sp. AZ194 TaxID=2774629 RepID=UPI003F68384D
MEILLESYTNNRLDVGIYYDLQKLLLVSKRTKYDVYFLDIKIPNMSGTDLTRNIRKG